MGTGFWQWIASMRPKYVIGLIIGISALSVFFTAQIRFSYDYEDFFPKGDPDLDFYYLFRDKFEHDDNFLMVGLEPGSGIFDPQFLQCLDSATRQINRLPNVDRTYSIANFRYFIHSPFGFIDYPAVHTDDTSRYSYDSLRMLADERIMGKLISEDMKTTVIFIKTNDTISDADSHIFLSSVHDIMDHSGLSEYHLLGKINFEVELARLQRNEFLLYSFLSILLVTIITWLLFRSFWCVFIALLTVAISLLVFTGILGAIGIDQNIMSTLYPIVIIIVGISDAVHFLGKYILELRQHPDRKQALHFTLSDIGFATFLTAITSAIGFLTMLTSNVPPLRDFGIFSGLGVLVVYGVLIFFIAPLLKLFSSKQLDAQRVKDTVAWNKILEFVYYSGKNHARKIVLISVVILLIFTVGLTRISTNIHIEEGLPKGAQVTTDFHFFESRFNGFRPFEIAAIGQNGHSITEPAVLHQIDTVEQFIHQFPIINGLQSVTMIYKSLNRAYQGDDPKAFELPSDTSMYKLFENDLKKFKLSEMNILVSEDNKYGRISGFVSDVGTDSIESVQHQINTFIAASTDKNLVDFKVTGTGIIFDKNTEYLRRNIVSGVLLAFLCIGFVMALMFRDWKMVVISIIPNVIPLFICAGIMGFLHIELDAPTSIIFGISYGIAVDDTIHFLSKFRIERAKGLSVEMAIHNTFLETGKAVFTMSVILLFGFLILMLSPTAPVFNIGLLTGVTLFTAVWPDIFLLPIMLRKWIRD